MELPYIRKVRSPKSDKNCRTIFGSKKDNYKYASDYNQIKHKELDEIYDILISADPDTENTSNCAWIFKQYKNRSFRLEDVNRVREDLELYFINVENGNIKGRESNINLITYEELKNIIGPFEPFEVKVRKSRSRSRSPTRKSEDFETIAQDKTGILFKILNIKGACLLGSETKWCTARRDDKNMFEEYNKKGPLYVWYDNRGNKVKKYQFHFEDMQFMDEKDNKIDKKTLDYLRKENPITSKLFKEKEENIFENPETAYSYARDVIGGRWEEAEEYIMQDPYYANEYAQNVIKGRWKEVEEYIKKDPKIAYEYARYVIGGRWEEAEEYIKKDPKIAYEYAEGVIKGRWEKAEKYIKKDPFVAYLYAKNIIRDIWKEGEEYIKKDPYVAYRYARNVIKGRWKEAEEYIMQSPYFAYEYAKDVIGGRWEEAEEYIKKDPFPAYFYAKDIIKGRWKEAEPYIMKIPNLANDYKMFIKQIEI